MYIVVNIIYYAFSHVSFSFSSQIKKPLKSSTQKRVSKKSHAHVDKINTNEFDSRHIKVADNYKYSKRYNPKPKPVQRICAFNIFNLSLT